MNESLGDINETPPQEMGPAARTLFMNVNRLQTGNIEIQVGQNVRIEGEGGDVMIVALTNPQNINVDAFFGGKDNNKDVSIENGEARMALGEKMLVIKVTEPNAAGRCFMDVSIE